MEQQPVGASGLARKWILVVDDHPFVCDSLREMIDCEPDLVVKGAATDARTAISLVARIPFHLAMIDLFLGRSHGLELIKVIRKLRPTMRVIAVSMTEDETYIDRAFHAGANGFIHKAEMAAVFRRAARQVLDGQTYLSDEFKERFDQRARASNGKSGWTPDELLSDQELEVFRLTGQGLSAEAIAQRLGIRVCSVETYRARIRIKLGYRDFTDFVAHAGQWVMVKGFPV